MNGQPLTVYNDDWRMKTGSKQSWIVRWRSYWLPALISSKKLKPSKDFKENFSKIHESYRKFINYLRKRSPNSSFSGNFISKIISGKLGPKNTLQRSKVKKRSLRTKDFSPFHLPG